MRTIRSMTQADPLSKIVRSVLLVARLGEADHRGWWATQSFGAAGRVVLGQRLPRTWRMAAIEVDIASARNRHNEVIDRPNAVHLFSDNWPVRRWASAFVAEQKTSDPAYAIFEELEKAPLEAVAGELSSGAAAVDLSSQAVRVGSIQRSDFDDLNVLAPLTAQLAAVYGQAERFVVPYLEVT